MGISTGSARWVGGLKEGLGVMKPAHAGEAPYSIAARFDGKPGSNPEELIGAALAGCYSMALTGALEKAGLQPQEVRTTASVQLDKVDGAYVISGIKLATEATVPKADPAAFQLLAEETSRTCPVSKALGGVKITLRATLA